MAGRLVSAQEFQQVLRSAARARSEHFAAHHAVAITRMPVGSRTGNSVDNLSTDCEHLRADPVDNIRFGWVVPKRHARRSVTRNLIRRQMRECAGQHAAALPHGLWVVRLHRAFDPARFPSAGSEALRAAARFELERLFGRLSG